MAIIHSISPATSAQLDNSAVHRNAFSLQFRAAVALGIPLDRDCLTRLQRRIGKAPGLHAPRRRKNYIPAPAIVGDLHFGLRIAVLDLLEHRFDLQGLTSVVGRSEEHTSELQSREKL